MAVTLNPSNYVNIADTTRLHTLPKLKLEKRNAIHILERRTASEYNRNEIPDNTNYTPNYAIIDRYESSPYLTYSKIVAKVYIQNEFEFSYMPPEIVNLCYKFLYVEQDAIFQLAYFLSKITKSPSVSNKNKSKLIFASFTSGFTHIELINKMRNNIKGFKLVSNKNISNYCNLLIKSKYVQPIYSLFANDKHSFHKHDNNICKYELNQKTINLFSDYIKFKSYSDRLAWNIGTIVEINCNSNGWIKAQIIEIKHKQTKIRIIYSTSNGKISMKSVNRFDFDKVRSTKEFMLNRQKLSKNDEIEIYSRTKHEWYKGTITSIQIPNINKSYIDNINIMYNNNEISKCITRSRWNCDIRSVNKNTKSTLNEYKCGSKVEIWSRSNNDWMTGYIKIYIPTIKSVMVKYGKSEKIIQIASNQLQLL